MEKCLSCGATLPRWNRFFDNSTLRYCGSVCLDAYIQKEIINVAIAIDELRKLREVQLKLEAYEE